VSHTASLSLLEHQQLPRFRRAVRALLRCSDEAARTVGLTPPSTAIKGHVGPGAPSASDLIAADDTSGPAVQRWADARSCIRRRL